MSNASVRKNVNKTARSRPAVAGTHVSKYMWLSRIFSGVCFMLVLFSAVFSLSLIHMTQEADVHSTLVTAPTYSENLAYFQPLAPDMVPLDIISEMYIRNYITARNNVWKNAREMQVLWGPRGIVRYLSTPQVYSVFRAREYPRFIKEENAAPGVMVETDIKKVIKEGWNSWQIFFDTRRMASSTEVPVIEHWIATIQFRYYAWNTMMNYRLRNPLGFTVTQYHLATQKK